MYRIRAFQPRLALEDEPLRTRRKVCDGEGEEGEENNSLQVVLEDDTLVHLSILVATWVYIHSLLHSG